MRRRSTQQLHYAFDERNRLVIRNPLDLLEPTRVLEGRVSTDAKNRLVYHVDTSAGRGGHPGPHAIALDGNWKLAPNHDLALSLHESDRHTPQTLYLKGALIDAKANGLVFALRRSEDGDLDTAERLTLSGRWEADAKNRLTFLVEKSDAAENRLTLQGGWEIGEHHELLYRYRQRMGARLGEERTVIFDGAWDITRADRLVYRMSGSSDSVFEFKASLQSPSLQARDGKLVYQMGMGLSGGRAATKRLVLFGAWKLNKDRSVSFEVPYAHGRREAIRFNAAFTVAERNEIAVELLDRQKQPLGIAVTFSRRFLEDASWFVRLRKEGREAEVFAGVNVRF